MSHHVQDARPWWQQSWFMVLCCFLAIGGFLLAIEHRAHLWGIVPYLLLLACPLLHLFMHRGHGGHGGDRAPPSPGKEP